MTDELKIVICIAFDLFMYINIYTYIYIYIYKLRSTEGAIRGCQYGHHPSIQPKNFSFEGCIDEFGPY